MSYDSTTGRWHSPRGFISGWMRLLGILASVVLVGCGLGEPPPSEHADAQQVAEAPARKPYNVILVVMDALRADHLSLYGYERRTSPHLDDLASHGLVYRHAYSQANWTAPSMASVFTSTYQSVHQVTHKLADDRELSVLDDSLVTMAEVFRDSGYQTAAFSSQAWLLPETGFDQGFDVFRKVTGVTDRHESEHIVEAALAWLRQKRDVPFFAYLHILNPHSPYDPPEPFDQLWWKSPVPERLRPLTRLGIEEGWNFLLGLGQSGATHQEVDYLQSMYDAEIAYVDYWLGRLVEALRIWRLEDDTIIVLIADHGESFSEHHRFGHAGDLFNEQLHVPMLILNRRLFKERRDVDEPVELIDLMPTLLSLIHLPVPEQAQGEDLLRGHSSGVAYSEGVNLQERKIQDAGWSLIASKDLQEFQLYDLRHDPGELRDLWGSPEPQAQVLRSAMMELVRRCLRDPYRVQRQSTTADPNVIQELKALGYL